MKTSIAVCLLISVIPAAAAAQSPRANGETLKFQNYAGSPGNMHAVVAKAKGFCEKYNFHCELANINSVALGLQALIGKSIDVTQGGADLVAASIIAGADIAVVGLSQPAKSVSISVRNDLALPNRPKGYPTIMRDFKGKRIGVAARGTSSEKYFNMMLAEGGLKPEDVTYVAVGNPFTGYASLTIGRQIDAIIMYQPLPELCKFNKTCETVIDMTIGEGPASVAASTGANVIFAMRRETADSNPMLMRAFYAAMTDAAAWFADPANFEELRSIYTPLVSFGDMRGADEMRNNLMRDIVPAYSRDLVVKRSALQQILDDAYDQKIIDRPLNTSDVLWSKAPQVP